jgi:hypothetical protein
MATYIIFSPFALLRFEPVLSHQFAPMLKDLRRARTPREVVGFLFGPPGWQPGGHGETTEDLRHAQARTSFVP